MRMTTLYPRTRYGEVGSDLTAAHALLVKGGFVKQLAPGVYILLPLGFAVWRRIRDIVWDIMERHGVLNLRLPIIQPKELWEKTGRWQRYMASKVMFTTTEHHTGAEFGLAPTAEEVVTWLAQETIVSYRDLPVIWHQIDWKYRDEIRPRLGLLRGREFDMSDAYSFDRDEEGMRKSFRLFHEIYAAIFEAVGLRNFVSVQADSGAIGGQGSAEFMALSEESGEDVLITCSSCDYGANLEKADSRIPPPTPGGPLQAMHVEFTPDKKTVEALCALFPHLDATRMVKTIIFTVDADLGADRSYEVAVCIRGDLGVNLTKLVNALGAQSVAPADATSVRRVTGAEVGFAGPIGFEEVRTIFFDVSVKGLTNFLCGANQTDCHALDVNFGRDLPVPVEYHNLHMAAVGHGCPQCADGVLRESKGIEVGHIFMLQRGYAEKMEATFTDEDGSRKTPWMGCYGIGTTRLIQAIVEQNRDGKGIVWPEAVAPYRVHIVPTRYEGEHQRLTDGVYGRLERKRVSVLLDDRDAMVGVKFTDADLIGSPWRVTVGRRAAEGIVELRDRRTGKTEELTVEDLLSRF